jgi:hypothetical protein
MEFRDVDREADDLLDCVGVVERQVFLSLHDNGRQPLPFRAPKKH